MCLLPTKSNCTATCVQLIIIHNESFLKILRFFGSLVYSASRDATQISAWPFEKQARSRYYWNMSPARHWGQEISLPCHLQQDLLPHVGLIWRNCLQDVAASYLEAYLNYQLSQACKARERWATASCNPHSASDAACEIAASNYNEVSSNLTMTICVKHSLLS